MKVRPAAGIATVPVVVAPASAMIFVPSTKVRSWAIEPVFRNETS